MSVSHPETYRPPAGSGLAFRRVLLKLSGEALLGSHEYGLDPERIDEQVLASERRRAVAQALDTLPARHRHLMAVMLAEPVLDYEAISERTGIPRGSIGPIRGRCATRIAAHPAVRALRD